MTIDEAKAKLAHVQLLLTGTKDQILDVRNSNVLSDHLNHELNQHVRDLEDMVSDLSYTIEKAGIL